MPKPDWKQGPVTLKNWDQRMAWHGRTIKMWGDNWPFLSNDPTVLGTADRDAWERYFKDCLGGFPASYTLFSEDRPYRWPVLRYYNLPEASPELFDPSYEPGRKP